MKHNSKSNDLRLWVEYNEKPKEMIWLKEPCTQSPWIVVFIKQFDAQNQTLKGVGHAHMRKNDRVQEIMPAICDIAKIPHRTDLILFEEIKPTMIEPIKGKQTFQQAEIQDGDIICFQVPLDPAELEFIKEKKLPKDPKEFYDKLVNLVAIRFLPKNKQQREFVLPLSKKNTYDEVAEKVGAQLGVPPTHLRFMTVNASNSLPRSIIKRTPTMQLTNMVTPQYYTTSPISTSQLIYEVLEMSLAELETKKTIKFVWLPEGVAKEEATEYLVPKNGTVEDLIPHLLKKFNVSEQAAATRLRFFIAHQGKFQKEIPHNFGAAGIQDFTTLYAELVPQEELDADLEVCRMIEAFHFQKEPSKTHIQGVPFKFVVKKVGLAVLF